MATNSLDWTCGFVPRCGHLLIYKSSRPREQDNSLHTSARLLRGYQKLRPLPAGMHFAKGGQDLIKESNKWRGQRLGDEMTRDILVLFPIYRTQSSPSVKHLPYIISQPFPRHSASFPSLTDMYLSNKLA